MLCCMQSLMRAFAAKARPLLHLQELFPSAETLQRLHVRPLLDRAAPHTSSVLLPPNLSTYRCKSDCTEMCNQCIARWVPGAVIDNRQASR